VVDKQRRIMMFIGYEVVVVCVWVGVGEDWYKKNCNGGWALLEFYFSRDTINLSYKPHGLWCFDPLFFTVTFLSPLHSPHPSYLALLLCTCLPFIIYLALLPPRRGKCCQTLCTICILRRRERETTEVKGDSVWMIGANILFQILCMDPTMFASERQC
jgi:hypothetical protein